MGETTKRGPQVRKDKYFKNTTVIRSKNSKLLAISLLFEVFKFLKQIAFFNSLKAPVLYIHVYLALPTRAGSPQPNPPCQLSLWEETGVPGGNPRLSAER